MSTPEQDRLFTDISDDLMDTEDAPRADPQGLATFDPMSDPGYRAVARRIADKYLCENGMQPWTWPEDAGGLRHALRVEDLSEDDLARIRDAKVDKTDEYRVTVIPTAQGYDVVVDHIPTWRRKSGSVAQQEYIDQMAQGLREDIEADLADLAAGHMPESAGRRTPEAER
jgi:hypothetical protein